jgi:hypothetical protein
MDDPVPQGPVAALEVRVAAGADGAVSVRVAGTFLASAVKRPLDGASLRQEVRVLEGLEEFQQRKPDHAGVGCLVRMVRRIRGGGYEVHLDMLQPS